MPRRKRPETDMLETRDGTPIMPVLVTRHPSGPREKHIDPYEALDGGAPQEKTPKEKRVRKSAAQKIADDLALAQLHAKDRENRTDLFLDALVLNGGDRLDALQRVYRDDLTPEEVLEHYHDLLAEIQRGLPASSVGELLEQYDVSTAARIKVLRKHLYSNVPAASLKAADMLGDLDNRPQHSGATYEHYVRVVMSES